MSDWRRATAQPFGGAALGGFGLDHVFVDRSAPIAVEVDNARLRGQLSRLANEGAAAAAQNDAALAQARAAVAQEHSRSAAAAEENTALRRQAAMLKTTVSDFQTALDAEQLKTEMAIAKVRQDDASAVSQAQGRAEMMAEELRALSSENTRLEQAVGHLRKQLTDATSLATEQQATVRQLTADLSRFDPTNMLQHWQNGQASSQLQGELVEKLDAVSRALQLAETQRDDARTQATGVQKSLGARVAELTRERDEARGEARRTREVADATRMEMDGIQAETRAAREEHAFLLAASRGKGEKAAEHVQRLAEMLRQLRAEHEDALERLGRAEAVSGDVELKAEQRVAAEAARTQRVEGQLAAALQRAETLEETLVRVKAVHFQGAEEAAAAAVVKRHSRVHCGLHDASPSATHPLGVVPTREPTPPSRPPTTPPVGRWSIAETRPVVIASGQRVPTLPPPRFSAASDDDTPLRVSAASGAVLDSPARLSPRARGDGQISRVKVRILRCTGLLSRADRLPGVVGRADPFVVTTAPDGSEVLRTPTVEASVDPVFPGEQSSGELTLSANGDGVLEVTVWDWNPLGHCFLGGVRLTPSEIFGYGPCTRTLLLQPRPDEPETALRTAGGQLGFVVVEIEGPPPVARAPPPVAVAPLYTGSARRFPQMSYDVSLSVLRCNGLIERVGGTHAFVVGFDPNGVRLLQTRPAASTTVNPRFSEEDPGNSGGLTLSPATIGGLRFEVWGTEAKGREYFLGVGKFSVEDVFAFGVGTRTVRLLPREKESDRALLDADSLGTVTVAFSGGLPAGDPPLPALVSVPLRSRGSTASATTSGSGKLPPRTTASFSFRVQRCDALLGPSDNPDAIEPFVVVMGPSGSEVLKTTRMPGERNPVWTSENPSAVVQMALVSDSTAEITVEVWSWSASRNDFLGVACLSASDIFARGSGVHCFPLRPRMKENDAFILANSDALGTVVVEISGLPSAASLDAGDPSQPVIPDAALLESVVPSSGNVTLTVLRCRNLMDRADAGTGVAPYVAVTDAFGREVLRTEDRPGTLCPDFDRSTSSLLLPLSTALPGNVVFEVRDRRQPRGGACLGIAVLPVVDVFRYGPGSREFRLRPRPHEADAVLAAAGDQHLGSITVRISGVPPVDVPPAPPPYELSSDRHPRKHRAVTPAAAPPPNEVAECRVSFHVAACDNLLKRDGGGLSGDCDPFVTVSDFAGSEILRTPVSEATTCPRWPAAPSDHRATLLFTRETVGTITVAAWNWNRTGADDFLGECRISATDLFALGSGRHRRALRPRHTEIDGYVVERAGELGAVTVDLGGLPESAPVPVPESGPPPPQLQPASPLPPEIPPGALLPPAGETQSVGLYVAACHRLLSRVSDPGMGECDPFVVVNATSGAELLRTPTVECNADPTWERRDASVTVQLGVSDALRFEVWNWTVARSEFLGAAMVTGAEIFADAAYGQRTLALRPRSKENDDFILEHAHQLGAITIFASDLNPAVGPFQKTSDFGRFAAGGGAAAALSLSVTGPAVARRPVDADPGDEVATSADAGRARTTLKGSSPPAAAVKVRVAIFGCTGLLDRSGGTGSPRNTAVVAVAPDGAELLRTATAAASLSPEFDAFFEVTIIRPEDTEAVGSLANLVVVDVTDNDSIGCCAVPLAELLELEPTGMCRQFDLPLEGGAAGRLQYKVTVISRVDEDGNPLP